MKRLEKIIVPTDLSESSLAALRYASSLAADERAALVVVHVADEFNAWELYDDAFGYAERWPLDRVLAEATLDLSRFLENHLSMLERVPNFTKRIAMGPVAHQIIAAAEEEHADLIVMAPRRRRSLGALLRGGITERVTRMSPCPVLSVTTPLPSKQWRGKILPAVWSSMRPSTESV